MNIKIYAPVDCEIKSLSDCTDDAFKNGYLGEGILVIPNGNEFVSPFESATVKMIFDTKHAYGFKVGTIDALIHCGLETVSLKGEPFNTKLNLEQSILKGDALFSVDLAMILKNKLSIETPIVFDTTNVDNFKILDFKPGNYKQGDLIAQISYSEKVTEKAKTKEQLMQEIATGNFKLNNFKSKYEAAAEQFIEAVGGPKNFKKVYNCMTRVRFQILDKNLVKQDEIKKNKLVKGINWAGTELQIIIGGECYKVREEIEKILKNGSKKSNNDNTIALTKTKKTFKQKFLSVIGGVMIPTIPALMALGLIGAIFGILQASGVIEKPGDDAATGDMATVVLYAMYNTALIGIGIFFCYNTVKFLGGNPIMGIMVGLILSSRFLLGGGTEIGIIKLNVTIIPVSPTDAEYASIHFGQYVNVPFYQLKGFYLFHMGDYPVLIKSYENSILPFIGAAVLYYWIDKWIKKWMPASIDICFRPPLAIFITIVGTLIIVAPILSLVEFAFLRFFQEAEKLPLGLGSAIFATLWEPLVITGTHVAVGLAVALPVYLGHSSALWAATGATGSGQVGATIGVAIRTKNKNLRSVAWSSIIAAYFGGVSEPLIYGINLPKVIPFLCGLVASFIGGWLYGILKIDIDFLGPAIFPLNLVSFTGHLEWLKVIICTIVSYAAGIGLTVIFYRERKDEAKLTNKTLKKLAKIAKLKATPLEILKLEELQVDYIKKIKSKKADYIKYEKYIQKLIDIENKLAALQDKEEKMRKKLYDNAQKLLLSEKAHDDKKFFAVEKYNTYSLEEKRSVLETKKTTLMDKNKDLVLAFNAIIAELEKDAATIANAYFIKCQVAAIKSKENDLWNAIHAVQIGYGYEDERNASLTKGDNKEIKEISSSIKLEIKQMNPVEREKILTAKALEMKEVKSIKLAKKAEAKKIKIENKVRG